MSFFHHSSLTSQRFSQRFTASERNIGRLGSESFPQNKYFNCEFHLCQTGVLDTSERICRRMFPPISSLRAEVCWVALPLMSTRCCCDQTLTSDLLFLKSQSDLCCSFRTKYFLTLLLSLSNQLATVLLQVYGLYWIQPEEWKRPDWLEVQIWILVLI